ncbi:MAG TPA: LptF/LptG family permease [Caulobacteraceae bacterium]|jgi:lipopolysaccharide export system permease protein|nr:LptF/LptG family permease [Caulobacteraceae bacterium]
MRGDQARPGFFHTGRWRLTRIERYVVVRSLLAVAAALGVITTLIMLIDFVNVSRNVGVKVDIPAVQVLYLTVLKAPNDILLLLPFAFLFGVLGAFVGLNRRSELVAMRAAGVSAWRFIFPAAGAAFAIGWITILAINPLASWMNGEYESEALRLSTGISMSESQSVWLRQGDGHSQVVIHALSKPTGGDLLRDVSFFVYSTGDKGQLEFSRLIEAKTAVLNKGFWLLSGAREAGPGEQAVLYETLSIPSNLNPSTAYAKFAAAPSVPFQNLPAAIHRVQAAGFSATTYRLKLQQLLATPLLFAAMSILGAAFSLRLMRLGGLAVLTSSGVALGFIIFFFNELCGALGKADVIPPALAGWAPPILALLSAFTLLCYTEDG